MHCAIKTELCHYMFLALFIHKYKAHRKNWFSSFIPFIYQFAWKDFQRHLCVSWNRNSIKSDSGIFYIDTQLGELPIPNRSSCLWITDLTMT